VANLDDFDHKDILKDLANHPAITDSDTTSAIASGELDTTRGKGLVSGNFNCCKNSPNLVFGDSAQVLLRGFAPLNAMACHLP
jgi:hypothetical protein